jgi:hypothetical protein
MGTKGLRLAAAVALAIVAACGSGKDPGGVSSDDIRRPSIGEGDGEAAEGGEGRELSASLGVTGVTAPPPESGSQTALVDVEYEVGDCLTWDVAPGASVQTRVVPCEQPHRMQAVGSAQKTDPIGADYPSEAEWDGHTALECTPLVTAFLDHPLDPYGRFGLHTIRPLHEGWSFGDREVICGIGARPANGTEPTLASLPFSGDMRTVIDQQWDHPVGSCLDRDHHPVGCDQLHESEVVARFAYSDAPNPPDAAAREVLLGECEEAVGAYMGGAFTAPWAYSLEDMPAESWAAGSRHVHCLVGQGNADLTQWVEFTGPAPRE